MALIDKAQAKFQHLFAAHGAGGKRVATRAPGRVNLIGDHTDYNGGLVLPMNIGVEAIVIAERRKDEFLHVYSLDFDEKIQAPVGGLQYRADDGWANYVKASLEALRNQGHRIEGLNLVVGGNIPHGSGLSSSSALEVAVAYAAALVCGFAWEPLAIAKAMRHGENDFMGVKSGLMDPLCITGAKKDHAMFLDCREETWEDIPAEIGDARFVVINSGTSRSLKTSEYNKRRQECERALGILKKRNDRYQSLRDIGVVAFERHKKALDPLLRKRVEHVIYENERVQKAAQALKDGNPEVFGQLMLKSHRSLQNLFNVSTNELDSLVDFAMALPEVYGARMTGGGFGGCTVNLVKEAAVPAFVEKIKRYFHQRRGMTATVVVCDGAESAGEIEIEQALDMGDLDLEGLLGGLGGKG